MKKQDQSEKQEGKAPEEKQEEKKESKDNEIKEEKVDEKKEERKPEEANKKWKWFSVVFLGLTLLLTGILAGIFVGKGFFATSSNPTFAYVESKPTSTQLSTVQVPTPVSTPIPTFVPTLIPFPSFEDFMDEVRSSCVPPTDIVEPRDGDEVTYLILQNQMYLWLREKAGKENLDYVGVMAYPYANLNDWYCVAVVLVPSQSKEAIYDQDWGTWGFPVELVFWSHDGLVTYNYEPAIPAP